MIKLPGAARFFLPVLILLSVFIPAAQGCSVFSAASGGGRVMARNFDWADGNGYLLYSAPGLARTADSGFTWKSGLGSLTWHLNTQGNDNYSIGGINEKGLAIEAVWLRETDYGPAQGAELNETEWITYNLDRYGSVREVVANAAALKVGRRLEPLHYMGCDASECFALEYLNGKMVLLTSKDMPYPVLTNVPYKKGIDSLPSFQGFGGDREMAGTSPTARFARASYYLSTGGSAELPAVFSALSSLKIPAGNVSTKWSYVYDLANKEIVFEDSYRVKFRDIPAAPHAGLTEKILFLPR
jgi:choloylglycine hydrolase